MKGPAIFLAQFAGDELPFNSLGSFLTSGTAKEGTKFIRDQIIHVTDQVFDDLVGTETDAKTNKTLLGID